MAFPIKVALLYGGRSGEHEVSLASAATVLQFLDEKKYQVTPIAIDKNGVIHVHEDHDDMKDVAILPVQTPYSRILPSLIEHAKFAVDVDVVLSIIHGRDYEDGCLQGILRQAHVAFVGSDVLGSAIGMSKDIAKQLAIHHDILTARYLLIEKNTSEQQMKALIDQALAQWGFPIFVKPSCTGSSVGIHKAQDMKHLLEAIADAFCYDNEVLLEECIIGREIEVAVLEDYRHGDIKVSMPGEIKVNHRDGFYSYAAKYLESETSTYLIPAPFSKAWIEKIQHAAKEIFKRLKCRGMARVDFFFDEIHEKLYFNDVNTIPGFASISFYPRLWSQSGLGTSALLDILIDTAILQYQARLALVTDFYNK